MSVHDRPLGASTPGGRIELRLRPAATGRAVARDRRGVIGLCGLLLTGLLLSISAAQTDALLPESIRPVPASLAGAFGTSGPNLHVIGLIAVMGLMFGSYVLAANSAAQLPARAVLITIGALHALMLLGPPLLSTDIFSYQAYARIGAVYGANPFVQGPHAIALDPVFPYIGAKWSYIPSAYGPVFTVFSYVLAPLSVAASVLAYKSLAMLASLTIVWLVWSAARIRGLDPVRAVALVGLNPLLVVYGVGGGHNDLLMLAAVMGGVYMTLVRRERWGGGLGVLAIAIKLTAIVPGLFAFAGAAGRRTGPGRRDFALGAGVMALLVAGLSFAFFGTGSINLLSTVRLSQSEGDWHSIPGLISTGVGLPPVGHVVGVLLALGLAFYVLKLLRRVWRGELDWINGAAWATVAMLATASSLLPWYVAWLLPLAALGTDRRLFKASLVMTGVVQGIVLLGYIPHATSLVGV
ncbi:MAG TPA: polyprenol phosphomannose-dependent alpha 1,6 mannosyltransferase MptB [Solirubrobacteraceae bacterium]|jgi:alpha-1,6-mannosyltransferase